MDHTGPNNQAGGAQLGFAMIAYICGEACDAAAPTAAAARVIIRKNPNAASERSHRGKDFIVIN
jgi:hypothetical protein